MARRWSLAILLAAGPLLFAPCGARVAGAAPITTVASGPRIALRTIRPRTVRRTLLTVDPTGLVQLFTASHGAAPAPAKPDRWKRLSHADLTHIAEASRTAQTTVLPDEDRPPCLGARPTPDACGHTLVVSVDGASREFRYGVVSRATPAVQALVRTIQDVLDRQPWKAGPATGADREGR